jgi:hypothetical protein
MDKRMQKLLLVILTLALAIAPLRAAWSIPDSPATDTESHCAQMQQQEPDAGSAEDCKQGCDGACCDDTCNACVHGTITISGFLTVIPGITGTQHNEITPVIFTGRTVSPLLRPPASL